MKESKTFFSTAESLSELLYTMETTDQNHTLEAAERWLAKCKSTNEDPLYWDKMRIFRVTIEEVSRVKP